MRMSDALWERIEPLLPLEEMGSKGRKASEGRPRLYGWDILRVAHRLPVEVHASNVWSARHRAWPLSLLVLIHSTYMLMIIWVERTVV